MELQLQRLGLLQAQLRQLKAGKRLRTSQPYLSQLEKGLWPVTPELARRATKVYGLSPIHFPVPKVLSRFFSGVRQHRAIHFSAAAAPFTASDPPFRCFIRVPFHGKNAAR